MKATMHAYRSIVGIVLATAAVLMVPLVAMLLSGDVVWSLFDFVAFGTLLLGVGLAFHVITSRVDRAYRVAVGLALIALFLLIWVELAVGVLGTPLAGS